MIGISLVEENNFEKKNNAVKVGYVVPYSPAEKVNFGKRHNHKSG